MFVFREEYYKEREKPGDHDLEAMAKWRARREREVRNRTKNVPHSWHSILGDAFRRVGVPVFYSVEDADDTIAASGIPHVLSRDKDFLRYEPSGRFCVWRDYFVRGGRARLIRMVGCTQAEPRKIAAAPLPVADRDPGLIRLREERLYLRGAPSSDVRDRGNPHAWAAALRHAVYADIGVPFPVTEEFPEWEDDRVVWRRSEVKSGDASKVEWEYARLLAELEADASGMSERDAICRRLVLEELMSWRHKK